MLKGKLPRLKDVEIFDAAEAAYLNCQWSLIFTCQLTVTYVGDPSESGADSNGSKYECHMLDQTAKLCNYRRHVLHDLKPYVCTFELCRETNQTFASRRSLFRHERSHRDINLGNTTMRCNSCHVQYVNLSDKKPHHCFCGLLLSKFKRKPGKNESTRKQFLSLVRCPVCNEDFDRFDVYDDHISRHLEEVSYIAVTIPYEDWDFYTDLSTLDPQAAVSDPPDLFQDLHATPLDPPASDMFPSDPDFIPHERDLRFGGDLYTPRLVRDFGNKREGWCGICRPGRWLVLKNSAYWYDKSFTHGVSAATGKPFEGPTEMRRVAGDPEAWEGHCKDCDEWISLASTKKKGNSWFRHAFKVQFLSSFLI